MLSRPVAALLLLACLAHCHTIDRVVVLMEENRSFDHMLGFLKRVWPEVNGLTGDEFNYERADDPTSPKVTVTDDAPYVAPWDPCHALPCVTEQIFGSEFAGPVAKMDGFIQNAITINGHNNETLPMRMFTPEAVPIISTLAQEFALFDEWFCSVPSDTNPNRRFVHAATAYGSMDDSDYYAPGFPGVTTFQKMMELNKTTGIYYTDWSPACMYQWLRTPQTANMFHSMADFLAQARNGTIPNYSFLSPQMYPTSTTPANDQHPSHDVREGERLMKSVYEALRAGPLWNNTLFIITYDEHGGFYDHVPTTMKVPNPDGRVCVDPPFDWTRGGIRVPTVMISPWIDKQVLVHGATGPTPTSTFEASSIPATLKKLFGWDNFLTKRDAWAGTFEDVYSVRTTPRTDCPMTLPEVPNMSAEALRREGAQPLSGLQKQFMLQGCVDPYGTQEAITEEDLETLTQAEAGEIMAQRFRAFLGHRERRG